MVFLGFYLNTKEKKIRECASTRRIFGRTVLPEWPFWAHLFYSVFYSVSELRRPCFRQARVARAVLPPGALFRAGAFALPPCAPKSHMRPLPHLGVSDRCTFTPAIGVEVHLPHAILPLRRAKARGGCTFTLKRG